MDLVLVTESYPFDGAMEQTFLEPEIEVLQKRFARIVLVPQSLLGKRLIVPGDPLVRTDFAEGLAARKGLFRNAWAALSLGVLGAELREHPWLLLNPRVAVRLGRFLLRAAAMERWVQRFLAEDPSRAGDTVFYTWWADACTLGVGLVKRRRAGVVVVSRAHSADLYPGGSGPRYQPCRAALYRHLDRLYPDSERGAEYVNKNYKWFADRCVPARQGVADPGFLTAASADGVFRVLSCSNVIPRKRVGLLAGGLSLAASRRPDRRIEWTHIGDGPLRPAVEQQSAASNVPNFSSQFLGMLAPNEMFEYYRSHPIDLFANVSDREGTPVSLMEAASCGMPILATAVGGNVEVVSDEVGFLLSEHPDEGEIADAVLRLIDHPETLGRHREGARRQWTAKYNAATNYQRFADDLVRLRATAHLSAS